MEVVRLSTQPEHEIRIGDMFQTSSSNKFYVLMDLPTSFALRNMSGDTHYITEQSLDKLKDALRHYVSSGRLVHYPASKYKLQIVDKEES